MGTITRYDKDNYKFIGKQFDFVHKNLLNSQGLLQIIGKIFTDSVDYELSGMGDFAELPEYNGTLQATAPHRGFTKIITPREYSDYYDLSIKRMKNDRTGECNRAGSKMGSSVAMTEFLKVLRLFGNFTKTSTDYVGGDGKAWGATDHPNASLPSTGRTYTADTKSGTYSNLGTEELSRAAIDNARTAMCKFLTPAGLPYLCNPDMILVSQDLEPEAAALLGRTSKLTPMKDPDSAENAASSISDLRYIVVGAGADGLQGKQWALCDSSRMKETVKIITNTEGKIFKDVITGDALVKRIQSYIDFGVGFGDARQIYFSNPS